MACKVSDITSIMEAWAPAHTAEKDDNVGLLVGFSCDEVNTVLISLDFDRNVLAEAIRLKAELIITHHPLIYKPVSTISDSDAVGLLVLSAVRAGISIFAAHTNLDRAVGGVNDALCQALGFQGIQAEEGSIARIVDLETDFTLESLVNHTKLSLKAPFIRATGERNSIIRRLFVVSGSGRHEIDAALAFDCDALLTGEIDYHAAQSAKAMGLAVIEAGHYFSEMPVLNEIEKHLQKESGRLEYNIRTEVYKPATCPFWFIAE